MTAVPRGRTCCAGPAHGCWVHDVSVAGPATVSNSTEYCHLHGEGAPVEVSDALLCHAMEEGWFVLIWGVVVVGQLDKDVALQDEQHTAVFSPSWWHHAACALCYLRVSCALAHTTCPQAVLCTVHALVGSVLKKSA